jgi:tRNA 2-selenouridine synthase
VNPLNPSAPPRSPASPLVAASRLAEAPWGDTVIDVRSPGEYAEDRVPGAINCPVLDDDERARVGTLYKQVGPFEARRIGGALAARNIARHVEGRFQDHPRQWAPLVYCWRGGQRSRAFVHVLREIGWRAVQLEGGYRAFRRLVIDALGELPGRLSFRVLSGRTGCGKSRLLGVLASEGHQVLDLEALAAHRGSVLGNLPDVPQPAQKAFESALWDRLRGFDPSRPVFVEAESRRIGVLHLPDALIARMRAAPVLTIEADLSVRTALLLDEYRHLVIDTPRLHAQLDCLRHLHGHDTLAAWRALAEAGRWDEFVAALLEQHYDPAYDRSMFRNYGAEGDRGPRVRLQAGDEAQLRAAARQLAGLGDKVAA